MAWLRALFSHPLPQHRDDTDLRHANNELAELRARISMMADEATVTQRAPVRRRWRRARSAR